MKTFLVVALLCVAGAMARSAVKDANIKAEGPECPIDDPLVTEPGPLNVSLAPILVINEGGSHDVVTIKGLSTLMFSYDVNVITLSATGNIKVEELDVSGAYADAVGYIDATPLSQETLPTGNFTGFGDFTLKATNLEVDIRATLFINLIGNKVGIFTLTINTLSFGSLEADFGEGYLLDGAQLDWAEWSSNVKVNFDREFAQYKSQVTEKIRLAINGVIGKYTLEELLELIGNIGGPGEPGEGCVTKIFH